MKIKYPHIHPKCFGKKERRYLFNNTTFIVEPRYEDMRDNGLTAKEAIESVVYIKFAHSTENEFENKMIVERKTVGKEDNEK